MSTASQSPAPHKDEKLRQLFHFSEADLQKNELGIISKHQRTQISKRILMQLLLELGVAGLTLLLFLWVTNLLIDAWFINGVAYLFGFGLAIGIPLRRALKVFKTFKNGTVISITDDLAPNLNPAARQKVNLGTRQLTPKVKESDFPNPRAFYRFYIIDELHHILSAEYLGKITKEARAKFNNNGLFPTEHINESLRALFDYSEKELIENQEGQLSNRQKKLYLELARRRILPDFGLSLFMFGLIPLLFNEFVVEARHLLARRISIFGVLLILSLPLLLYFRRRIAVNNNQIFQKITTFNSITIFNSHNLKVLPREISMHDPKDLFHFHALKGYFYPKDIYASVAHIRPNPLKPKVDPLKTNHFQEQVAQTLMQHFSFTQKELRLNQSGEVSARQRQLIIKSFIPPAIFFGLLYISILAMVIYTPKNGGILEFFIIAFLLLPIPIICIIYLLKKVLPSLRTGQIQSVCGPIDYHRHKKAVFLKIEGQQLLPMLNRQRLPDPTGIYRFYYLTGLNHVLSAEYVEPQHK